VNSKQNLLTVTTFSSFSIPIATNRLALVASRQKRCLSVIVRYISQYEDFDADNIDRKSDYMPTSCDSGDTDIANLLNENCLAIARRAMQ